ncbi:50S ribosomal protein L3 [Dethiosulfatarculus sandiegensis]|jgi:large subunit ribosomal protein L3|uniref:Large ribosomal subunit protein uL3 n=1 Tax=Dethiosulfatarculus sandiegensis TaxID=1429043 RepID=A0A0D2I0B5_9BACT|nr:50S ribosomal protein L3 [Dethiosulfatarculus sandiegensis]KIX15953.1 50S ribosomal protein L3 [Dethiosulfatarculus sandiegensis]
MLKGLIGKKLGMTRLFLQAGKAVPVTVLEVGPCKVVQVKTAESDKYEAVQLGFGTRRAKVVNKPQGGHYAKAGVDPCAVLKEFRTEESDEFQVGQEFTAEMFAQGDKVNISAKTKGRGFQGVVKRHGFAGGRDTHGCTTHKKPGSIGASATPARVIKGKKLPGQYGNEMKTVRNVKVVDVRPDQNLVLVSGAVPGANGGIVFLEKA